MSEFKPISPLLDGFVVGEHMSEHHGVRCYPAILESTGEQFILKVISIPASQIQVDALFLTGAFSSREQAMSYFEETANGIIQEADILEQLAKLEGFISYSGIHRSEMENGTGYEVYLISPYKRSLRKQMQKAPLTHLGAVNLGLDLCAALATSRRAGYLYTDLKPNNIFLTPTKGWRLGDLGFVSLSSLKYASIPDRYRSEYTAPEIADAMSELNDTIDVYALGLVLYQIYNNGELPTDALSRSEQLAPPPYADYELAEIILRACDPNPANRWPNPAKMGHALVDYMQRNTINDTPIIPPSIGNLSDNKEIPEDDFLSDEENETVLKDLMDELPDEEIPQLELDKPSPDENPYSSVPENISSDQDETQVVSIDSSMDDKDISDARSSNNESPLTGEEAAPSEDEITTSMEEVNADLAEELSFIDDSLTDETAPSEESTAELDEIYVTQEVTQMLAQADELISHELPEPVVAPDPIDIPFPAPINLNADETCDNIEDIIPSELPDKKVVDTDEEDLILDSTLSEAPEEVSDSDHASHAEPVPPDEDIEPEYISKRDRSKKKSSRFNLKFICKLAVAVCLLTGLILGAAFIYNQHYLQTIDSITIDGDIHSCTVVIQSDIKDELLSVVCTDTYGNSRTSSVKEGIALFEDLTPNMQYRILVNISGIRKLVGSTSGHFTTPQQTEIINFSAVAGGEDGSAILNFGINGPDAENWTLQYSSPNGNAQTVTFSGHTVTVTGLEVGEEYIFSLTTEEDCSLTGITELNYTAQGIIYAQDLRLTDCENGSIGVLWTVPDGVSDCNWIVRCYNDRGFDKTINTTDTQTRFQVPSQEYAYTIDVTAEGMTRKATLSITENPITVTEIGIPLIAEDTLTFTWSFLGNSPVNGWKVKYSIDHTAAIVLECETCVANLPYYPGSHYEITILPADETTCISKPLSYNAPKVEAFDQYRVSAEDMSFQMCLTPEDEDWDRHDVQSSDYRTSYAIGEKASFVIKQNADRKKSNDEVRITYIIREKDGGPISLTSEIKVWNEMWNKRYCELDIPKMPGVVGEYNIEIYFNGSLTTSQNFSII